MLYTNLSSFDKKLGHILGIVSPCLTSGIIPAIFISANNSCAFLQTPYYSNAMDKLSESLTKIVDIARLAPSVHNTQPWRISTQNNSIVVELDPRFTLTDGDPTGRETIISLGIFCEALTLSAATFGFACQSAKLDDRRAELKFDENVSEQARMDADSKIRLLRTRCTDRSIYKMRELSDVDLQSLQASSHIDGVQVMADSDPDHIKKTAGLTAQGIQLALSNPKFRSELSQYLVVQNSHKKRGISVRSLYIPGLIAFVEPFILRLGIALGQEVKLEKKRWLSSSGLVFITTDGDMPEYWFAAGKAYLEVALAIEALGLSQATSAATVEASTFHEDIEQMLGTSKRLQCVIRIGEGQKNRAYSPRVDAAELITSN